ncbi:MAG: hypothetical protein ACREFI_08820, partial [Stellaceae bacterium]
RMLSLAALKERAAAALVPAGTFEIDPKAAGVRGQRVFISLGEVDVSSHWKGKPLAEICEGHYASLIAETCRAPR